MTLNCTSLDNGVGNSMYWPYTRSIVLSVAQQEVIYAHARKITSGFMTNLLKMSLNVGLQATFLCHIRNWGC